MRPRLALLRVLLAGAVAVTAAGCGGNGGAVAPAPTGTVAAGDTPARTAGRPRVQTLAANLEVPWEIEFLPDGRALVTERPGRVRLLDADGRLAEAPVAEIEVSALGEGGLLGLRIDPQFEDNGFVYLYFTTVESMKLARYRLSGGKLVEDAVVLEGIEAGFIHDSGRIAFGPDDRLYVATGDAGDEDLAQDPGSRNGKILRLTPEQYRGRGGDPEIVSSGHRNPQGLDWEPGTDRLVVTEHGSTGFDEVNVIREGRNYGWPEVRGPDHGRFAAPLTTYRETIAPSGATFVRKPGSAWTGDYVLAALRGAQLRRLTIDGDRVKSDEPLFSGRYGRLRTVVEGPDGALYALTSNRDGRGDPGPDDDRILRIVPPER